MPLHPPRDSTQAGALREDQLETVIGSIRELDMDKVRAEIAAAEGSAEKK